MVNEYEKAPTIETQVIEWKRELTELKAKKSPTVQDKKTIEGLERMIKNETEGSANKNLLPFLEHWPIIVVAAVIGLIYLKGK